MSLNSFIPREFIEIALWRALPVLLINKVIFFMCYKYTKNVSVVDIGYTVGHFLAGLTYALYVGDIFGMDSQVLLSTRTWLDKIIPPGHVDIPTGILLDGDSHHAG